MPTVKIRRTWKVDNVLTDATSVKLSDPTGTYGVKRDDTDAAVVADGTAVPKLSTGTYEYELTTVGSVAYTAWVEIVYAGQTYHFEHDIVAITAPADPSLCTVQFNVKLGATAVSGAVCKARLIGVNHAVDGTLLSNEEVSDTTDVLGNAELALVRKDSIVKGSATYKIWVEINGKPVSSTETKIPAQSTILYEDLLP